MSEVLETNLTGNIEAADAAKPTDMSFGVAAWPEFVMLDGEKLKSGSEIQLRLRVADLLYSARLVNAEAGKSITLILEGDAIDPLVFLAGTDVACSCISSEAFLVFSSKVMAGIELLASDDQLSFSLQLTYPQCVDHLALEHDPRVNVDLVALLQRSCDAAGDDLVVSKLLNLSPVGLLATSLEQAGEVGDDIEVAMLLPIVNRKVNVKLVANVKHMRNVTDDKGRVRFYYGMQFVNAQVADILSIKSYLFDSLQRASRAKPGYRVIV